MLKNFQPRLYQETIFAACSTKNNLVVLPTGMGKSMIFIMLAAQKLHQYPKSKILILAPTKPLCEQHVKKLKEHLEIDPEKIILFTGLIKPEKRKEMWKDAKIIVSTPQGMENDIISSRIQLDEISLLTIDEAHRAVGDYSYVWIAKEYNKKAKFPRILALTASPGNNKEVIKEVCTNLFIEDIQIRTDEDPDLKPYLQEVKLEWIEIKLNEKLEEVRLTLKNCLKKKVNEMKEYGYIKNFDTSVISKLKLLKLQSSLMGEVSQGNKEFEILKTVSLASESIKIEHALELIETQGPYVLKEYMDSVFSQAKTSKVKAVQNLARDIDFRTAFIKTERLIEDKIKHPKMEELIKIINSTLKKNKESKIIIFTNFRDAAKNILEEVKDKCNTEAKLFVGQAKKKQTGINQKEQIKLIQEFRENKFSTIIMTSVGEEGLDIPKVDLVVFYEPVPSAIRFIQRKGRTGRQDKGAVKILVTKNTRDEGYRWSAFHKEKRMKRVLKELKEEFSKKTVIQSSTKLTNYINPQKEDKIKIYVDYREKGSPTIKKLIDLNAEIKLEKLENADYIISERCGIEFKTKEDFVNSIIDGRLIDQMKNLRRNFEKPLVIIEGEQDIYQIRNIHPNSIRGMLGTIAISFGIPIIQTKNEEETSSFIHLMAKREQEETTKEFQVHGSRKPLTEKEQQEYIVSSFPNFGLTNAKEILKKFKNIKEIINCNYEDLVSIDGIGKKKADTFFKIIDQDYKE